MNEGSNALVFWILVPLFVAVGLYLVWYSRRRKKMLEAFAKTHRFRIRPERKEAIQKTLDRSFSLDRKNLVRKFGQLSSLVDGGSVWLFRTVELIDLDPYAQAYVTHYSRIVALFDITTDHDEFFLLDKSMQAIPVLPGSKPPDSDVTEVARRLAASSNSRHALSVTLKNNRGLIYFQPFVVGGETLSDVDSLYSIAKNMCDELSGNV